VTLRTLTVGDKMAHCYLVVSDFATMHELVSKPYARTARACGVSMICANEQTIDQFKSFQ
jgi:dTDP-4-dehydrorhamnose 3,5-epimerase-like enzyme